MSRLVIAILILIAVLLGWKFVSSPFFQQNILNRIGASSQTQTTGFNTSVPADISTTTPIQPETTPPITAQPNTTAKPNNNGNASSGNANNGNPGNGSKPPARSLPPIPGGW